MKKYLFIVGYSLLFLLTGCGSNVGFGIGGAVGDSHGGTEILMNDEGIHGSVIAGGDFIR